MTRTREQMHATAIAIEGQGVLILGASGRGKSALALELVAMGARLISDDIVFIELREGVLHAVAPPTSGGRIEARGIGILRVPATPAAPLALCVDLDRVEPDRLPARHVISILGNPITLLHYSEQTHFPSALLHYVRYGRSD